MPRCRFISIHIETGEISKHFSYPDYFTYLVSQHGRLGQGVQITEVALYI